MTQAEQPRIRYFLFAVACFALSLAALLGRAGWVLRQQSAVPDNPGQVQTVTQAQKDLGELLVDHRGHAMACANVWASMEKAVASKAVTIPRLGDFRTWSEACAPLVTDDVGRLSGLGPLVERCLRDTFAVDGVIRDREVGADEIQKALAALRDVATGAANGHNFQVTQ